MNSVFMPSSSKYLLEIEEACLHRFDKRIRSQVADGICQIFESSAEISNGQTPISKTMYMKIEDFFFAFNQSQVLIRMYYDKRVCYLFYGHQSQLYCLSFDKTSKTAEAFDKSMSQALCVVDFSSEKLDLSMREKIVENCPNTIHSQDISYDSTRAIRSVGSSIGYAAGTLSRIFQNPSSTAALSSLSERANRFSEENISDNAKSKWNSVKSTSETINEAMTVVVSPAVAFFNNIAKNIGEQFYASENSVIKGIREYSLAISDSINKAEKRAKEEEVQERNLNQQVSAIGLR